MKKITPFEYDYFKLRNTLDNCRINFDQLKVGRVVFMGGSITEMSIDAHLGGSWRDIVMGDLIKRFPQTEFDFINAGISSLGSTPHSFRFIRDVLKNGPVDLLFIEAAVNDEVNGMTPIEMIRGMEGVVRQARLSNPNIDIIMMHFADPEKLKVINSGQKPMVVKCHEKVAENYEVSSIDLAKEVAERIRAKEFDWDKDFKNLHPSPFGHQLYGQSIVRLLENAWKMALPDKATLKPYKCPKPIDEKSYFFGRLVNIKEAVLGEGWFIDPIWKPVQNENTRKGFVNVPALISEIPCSVFHFHFEGTAVGIFVVAGPDAGSIEYSIDGGNFVTRDLFTPWSESLHLPWAQVLDADLPPSKHELTVKVSANGKRSAVRIMCFLVNGEIK